ncbi:MAG: fibrobacter succinogenes major paralogous domain-containing protein [Prevotella sp.]|jgi:uncharacterized protein (TIGR02145 family)|nr:fibrobacter succinogenes major paralogous domain-containing protein [Prevotella sp.]
MKQERLEITIFMLLLSASISLHGQVTIGAGKEPLDGAILDLKQKDAADGGVTSTLGIMLPRVKLINLQPTAATGANSLPVSIGAAASEIWDLSAHTGLTVYNVNMDVCPRPMIQKGAYTWTGTEWKYLGQEGTNLLSPDVHEFTDPRDGEKYLYRTFGAAGEWMLENLRYIPNVADGYPDYIEGLNTIPEAKYYQFVTFSDPYDLSTAQTIWESKYKRYGIWYNFPAVINAGDGSGITVTYPTVNETGSSTQPVRRGVCPPDWHVPSDYEWRQLTEEIKTNTLEYAYEAGNVDDRIGAAMRSPGEPFTGGTQNQGTSICPEGGLQRFDNWYQFTSLTNPRRRFRHV